VSAAGTSRSLPMRQLVQLSIYWFGLAMIFTALDTVVLPERLKLLVPAGDANLAVGIISACGAVVAVLVQPTIGSISDYTTSRWGRRKPYIVVGSTLDSSSSSGSRRQTSRSPWAPSTCSSSSARTPPRAPSRGTSLT